MKTTLTDTSLMVWAMTYMQDRPIRAYVASRKGIRADCAAGNAFVPVGVDNHEGHHPSLRN
jgi:hypothetical protein